jgi:hypothetical protein
VTASNNTLRYGYYNGFYTTGGTLNASLNKLKENACNTSTWGGLVAKRGAMASNASSAVLDAGGGTLGSTGGNAFCQASTTYDFNENSGTITGNSNCFDDSGTPTPTMTPAASVPTSSAATCGTGLYPACSSF